MPKKQKINQLYMALCVKQLRKEKEKEAKIAKDYDGDEIRFSQQWMADQMSVSLKSYQNWENQQACPAIDELYKLCGILECDIDYLFGKQSCPRKQVASVHDHTGLSEDAIRVLSSLTTNGEQSLKSEDENERKVFGMMEIGVLNDLITSELFPAFCMYLNNTIMKNAEPLYAVSASGTIIDKIGENGYAILLNNIMDEFIFSQKLKYNLTPSAELYRKMEEYKNTLDELRNTVDHLYSKSKNNLK